MDTGTLTSDWDRAGQIGSGDLEMATSCEERAQRLVPRLEEMEESIQLARMFLSASEAIEALLIESRRLLDKGRSFTEPASRTALADTYREIKNQIGDIVVEAGFNGQNLAAGDILEVAFDEDDAHILRTEPAAMSIEALGLSTHRATFEYDADIIETIIEIENAINTVRTRHTVIEMTLSMLESRAKFVQQKVASLRDASHVFLDQQKVHASIREIAARRVRKVTRKSVAKPRRAEKLTAPVAAPAAPAPAKASQIKLRNIAEEVKAEMAIPVAVPMPQPAPETKPVLMAVEKANDNQDAADDNVELDDLTKDLARHLKLDSYLTHWFRFERGERGVFTEQLARDYSPELIERVAERCSEDDQAKEIAERYMAIFETRIEKAVEGKPDRKPIIDELLKTAHGTVYVELTRACRPV